MLLLKRLALLAVVVLALAPMAQGQLLAEIDAPADGPFACFSEHGRLLGHLSVDYLFDVVETAPAGDPAGQTFEYIDEGGPHLGEAVECFD